MAWINPPSAHRTWEHELPAHGGELGLVFELEDGTVCETVSDSWSVKWSRCTPSRAHTLKTRFATFGDG